MRTVLLTVMALALGGCAGPRQWERAGADSQTIQQDLQECRRAAKKEAWRPYQENVPIRHPAQIANANVSGLPHPYLIRRDGERGSTEFRLTGACMRNKGYEFNPSPAQLSPTSLPRST